MKNLLFCLLVTLSLQSLAQTKNFIDQPFIEVTAMADTLVMPDKIHLTILLNEKDNRNKRSTEEMEKSMLKVLETLNIDIEKNLSLLDYSSDFKKYFLSDNKVLKSKVYSLILKDAKTVGKVLAGLENERISNVTISKTEYSKTEELILHLKSKVIYKAKQNAESLVKPLNQTIGKAIFISDVSSQTITNQLQGKVAGIKIRGASSLYGSKTSKEVLIDFKKMKFFTEVRVKFILD